MPRNCPDLNRERSQETLVEQLPILKNSIRIRQSTPATIAELASIHQGNATLPAVLYCLGYSEHGARASVVLLSTFINSRKLRR